LPAVPDMDAARLNFFADMGQPHLVECAPMIAQFKATLATCKNPTMDQATFSALEALRPRMRPQTFGFHSWEAMGDAMEAQQKQLRDAGHGDKVKFCNNPRCGLTLEKVLSCPCHSGVAYCNKECQKQDRPRHKPRCAYTRKTTGLGTTHAASSSSSASWSRNSHANEWAEDLAIMSEPNARYSEEVQEQLREAVQDIGDLVGLRGEAAFKAALENRRHK
jgi:hypothetical protein